MMRLFIALALACCAIQSAAAQPAEALRAVKITNVDSPVLFSDDAIAEAMDYLASVGINAVLPVVQNGGYTQYPSAVMERYFGVPIHPQFAGRDPLRVLIREAHRVGIEVYPWFEYGFASTFSGLDGPPNGGHILQTFPHWAARDLSGTICKKNGFDWMNGIHEEVQDFIIELVMEVVRNYHVDGVEFSDRMPAMPVECGYDDYTIELYRSLNFTDPPADFRNQTWKQWRANELSRFYARVRDSVKTEDPSLFVATSPNVYPWGFEEYLQDSRAWVNRGYVDHWIPQLYRYTLPDYTYELNQAWNQIFADKRHTLFAGILMNVGGYLITTEFLDQQILANRNRGVQGEAYFFYEGFRRNNNALGNHLKETHYGDRRPIPGRNGFDRRPPAWFMSNRLDEERGWRPAATQTPVGPLMVWDGADTDPESPGYFGVDFPVEADAFYDVYVWSDANPNFADSMTIRYRNENETPAEARIQINDGIAGTWFLAGTYRLGNRADGNGTLRAFEMKQEPTERPLAISGAMALVNRKRSTFVATSTGTHTQGLPVSPLLVKNYPNPFNPQTTIEWVLPQSGPVRIEVFDALGRRVDVIRNGTFPAGHHRATWHAEGLSGGIYLIRILTAFQSHTHPVLFVK